MIAPLSDADLAAAMVRATEVRRLLGAEDYVDVNDTAALADDVLRMIGEIHRLRAALAEREAEFAPAVVAGIRGATEGARQVMAEATTRAAEAMRERAASTAKRIGREAPPNRAPLDVALDIAQAIRALPTEPER